MLVKKIYGLNIIHNIYYFLYNSKQHTNPNPSSEIMILLLHQRELISSTFKNLLTTASVRVCWYRNVVRTISMNTTNGLERFCGKRFDMITEKRHHRRTDDQ